MEKQTAHTFYRDRIITLRDHLRDNVKDEQFDLDTFAGSVDAPWDGNLCQTVGCAVGHATEIPAFKKLGLRLIESSTDPYAAVIAYGHRGGNAAIQDFFNLEPIEVSKLFFSHQYPNGDKTTRQEVVDRLTAFLKGDEL